MSLAKISRKLSRSLKGMEFAAPVTNVYDPLDYARVPHERYLERWGKGPKQVVLLGMNPGPWGMAQTGVPFGEIQLVRDWLGVSGKVKKPSQEHPKRPVTGFDCTRREGSGKRLWGWAEQRFGTAARFFERFFVTNYCPLIFLESSGKNRTPDKLPKAEREPLFAACDRALRESIEALEPEWVLGVGTFAEARATAALEGLDLKIGRILHPSPANPTANKGWVEYVERQFDELGIPIP